MIFFDAYAIIEILRGNPTYKKFNNILFITNTLHLSEVFYSLLKETEIETARDIIYNSDFEFIEISDDIALEATIFRYENKSMDLSYADCIGYITAKKHGLKFLTGDKEFKNMKNVEFVK